MIIDFHVHVFPPEDLANFTGTGSTRTSAPRKALADTIENVLKPPRSAASTSP